MFPCRNLVRALCILGPATILTQAADLGPATDAPEPAPFAESQQAAQSAIRKFRVHPGFKVELVANEPQLKNPVAFHIGNTGKIYISETDRYRTSALDIRHFMSWYDDDLASQTVEDRVATIKKHGGEDWEKLGIETERIRLLEDRDGDGVAEYSSAFAEEFTDILGGIASGVMEKDGWVYFTNIPDLWRVRDTDNDGFADERETIAHGFGVHFSLTGHDLHGLIKGPDGRIYFTVGDRGAHVVTKEGRVIDLPDEGAAFRMEPDGTNLEVFARGLRNPQELAFNHLGDLFTGDNDCDHGDRERWVHIVEGADYGWRIGYQFSEQNPGGAWMSERIWWTNFPGRVAAYLPPLAHTENGPSGLTYYPGTGMPDQFKDTFFLCHFKGQDTVSGINMIKQMADGATYRVTEQPEFIWNTMPTDTDFGPDGNLYFTDWVEGWPKSEKGRVYRIVPDVRDPRSDEVEKLLADGMTERDASELTRLLDHADMRVRLEAHWELANRQDAETLVAATGSQSNQRVRMHAIWGIGQLLRTGDFGELNSVINRLLSDDDSEIRRQAARALGDSGQDAATGAGLVALLKDSDPRVRFEAATGISKLKVNAPDAIVEFLGSIEGHSDSERYLRHAGAFALAGNNDVVTLATLERDSNPQNRLAAVLGLRQLEHFAVGAYVDDADPFVAVEAARAINDAPINSAMPQLAAQIGSASFMKQENEVTKAMSAEDYQDLVARPMIRRVINANFRVGGDANAAALATFAAGENLPADPRGASVIEEARAEALLMLGQWANPSPRDKVLGLYRPLQARSADVAADELGSVVSTILDSAPLKVQVAAIDAAASLELKALSPRLGEIVANTSADATLRSAALKALGKLQTPEFDAAVALATTDLDSRVRRTALMLASQSSSGMKAPELAEVLNDGSIEDKQTALAALAQIPGTVADEIIYGVLRPWIEGQPLEPELELDVLEASRARADQRIITYLEQYEEALPEDNKTAAFHWAKAGGDVASGRKIFIEHPAAACYRCHVVDGGGGEVGPAMDGIASRVDVDHLLEAIIDPNAKIAEGFENLLIETANGDFYAGVIKEETDEELTINSPEEGVVTIKKADITTRSRGLSGMPEGLNYILSNSELRDLMAYLASLK